MARSALGAVGIEQGRRSSPWRIVGQRAQVEVGRAGSPRPPDLQRSSTPSQTTRVRRTGVRSTHLLEGPAEHPGGADALEHEARLLEVESRRPVGLRQAWTDPALHRGERVDRPTTPDTSPTRRSSAAGSRRARGEVEGCGRRRRAASSVRRSGAGAGSCPRRAAAPVASSCHSGGVRPAQLQARRSGRARESSTCGRFFFSPGWRRS